MILDGVVCSIVEIFGDDFPLISMDLMCIEDSSFFFNCPFFFIDFWIEMIYPSCLLNKHYLYRHCFPDLPVNSNSSTMDLEISVHRLIPCFFTSLVNTVSSCYKKLNLHLSSKIYEIFNSCQ